MGFKVVVREGKSMRIPLQVCASFGSDFDGDEINCESQTCGCESGWLTHHPRQTV
jgi:predicted Zn-ribbon and HTH transcriptional regulator